MYSELYEHSGSDIIRLLRAIDYLEEMEKLLPELPESPRKLFMQQQKRK